MDVDGDGKLSRQDMLYTVEKMINVKISDEEVKLYIILYMLVINTRCFADYNELWSYEVSTLYLENSANARRIYVFWVINPSFLTPPGVR